MGELSWSAFPATPAWTTGSRPKPAARQVSSAVQISQNNFCD